MILLLSLALLLQAQNVKALNFSAKDIEGKMIELDKMKGKVVLLDFWATWCGPCRKEIPNLIEIYKTHKDKPFEIISISLDKNSQKAINFVKKNKMDWVHIIGPETTFKLSSLYKIRYIPSMFIIDKTGKVISSNVRGHELKERLARLLK